MRIIGSGIGLALIVTLFTWSKAALSYETELRLDSSSELCEPKKVVMLNDQISAVMSSPVDACTLTSLNSQELRLLRNSIFAQHGRMFQDAELTAKFKEFTWYKEDASFSIERLTDIQKSNVRIIKLVEDLKLARNDTTSMDNSQDHEIHKMAEFVIPVSSLAQQHTLVRLDGEKLLFENGASIDLHYEKVQNPQFQEMITEQPSWRVTHNGVLIFRPYSYSGIEGGVCKADFYSFKGEFIAQGPCLDFIFKHNKDLGIMAHYSGCCGAYAWDIAVWNLATGAQRSFSCEETNCQDVLLKYIPASKSLLLAVLTGSRHVDENTDWNTILWILNDSGEEIAYSNITYTMPFSYELITPFLLSNLVGGIKLSRRDEWLFKFTDTERTSSYVHVTNNKNEQ